MTVEDISDWWDVSYHTYTYWYGGREIAGVMELGVPSKMDSIEWLIGRSTSLLSALDKAVSNV